MVVCYLPLKIMLAFFVTSNISKAASTPTPTKYQVLFIEPCTLHKGYHALFTRTFGSPKNVALTGHSFHLNKNLKTLHIIIFHLFSMKTK